MSNPKYIHKPEEVKAFFDCGQNENTVGYHDTKYWRDQILQNYLFLPNLTKSEITNIAMDIAEDIYLISVRESDEYKKMFKQAVNQGLASIKQIAGLLENSDFFVSDLHSMVTADALKHLILLNRAKLVNERIFKSVSNCGEITKTYAKIIEGSTDDSKTSRVMSIERLTLSGDLNMAKYSAAQPLRAFKDKVLWRQRLFFKEETWNAINQFLVDTKDEHN